LGARPHIPASQGWNAKPSGRFAQNDGEIQIQKQRRPPEGGRYDCNNKSKGKGKGEGFNAEYAEFAEHAEVAAWRRWFWFMWELKL
jgi:hypothetical protein